MITLDDLIAKTTPSGYGKKANVTFKLDPDVKVENIVEGLEEFFGKAPSQKVIKLLFDTGERRYLNRNDFMSLVSVGYRGIGAHDGGTLPGQPGITFIKLCCTEKNCKEVIWVTSYDEDDPPLCDDHQKPMKPC